MPPRVIDYRLPSTGRAGTKRARSRAVAGWLSLSFVLPFIAILMLYARNIPLGQGYFLYRWSPVRELRAPAAVWIAPVILLACGAVWLAARKNVVARRGGIGLFFMTLVAAASWGWIAPPQAMTQQMFNLTSPSSDGAFLIEAGKVQSLPQYLGEFPSMVGRETVESMHGTRVLSNPPGMTVFAYEAAQPDRTPAWIEQAALEGQGVPAEQFPLAVATVRLGFWLMIAWVAAGLAAYGLGRVFLSPAGAIVFAVAATFNPCTVNFLPGKDPAQLLTINAMLWAWFAGWKRLRLAPSSGTAGQGWDEGSARSAIDRRSSARRSNPHPALSRITGRGKRAVALSTIAGALLVIGSTFSLVHIWIAIAAVGATLWHHWSRRRIVLLKSVVPAVIGALLVIAAARVALDFNIPLTVWTTQRRWSELQKTFEMKRAVWYAIGLPIFLLFLSPGLWTLLGMSLRRLRMNFGTRLALCTAATMALIYFVFGVTYELPRLWVAFLPPLTLGLAIDWPLLRGGRAAGEHPRVAKVLMLIVAVQIFFTAFHWTFFDAREAEYRLSTKRFYQ
jgi:hypothetical protein